MMKRTKGEQSSKDRRSGWGLGSQLLLSVNGVLLALAVVFLTYDYHRDLRSRIEEKRVSLHEEAKAMMPAVLRMEELGRSHVQQYIDAVCGRMRDSESPGHHIIVETGTDVIQATAHHRASPEILLAIKNTARVKGFEAAASRDELVVGTYSQGATTVYVAETLKNVRRVVLGDVILRLIGLVCLAFAATAVVDYVLWRIVWRPINRLVATVQDIAGGNLGIQAGRFQCRELDYLAGEINKMSDSLMAVDRERAVQMAQAREIQQRLLPRDIEVAGMSLSSLFLPAEDVAGDYYDVISLPDGTSVICIADVTGHGVPAALNAMMLKVLLVDACERDSDPSRILEFVNCRLAAVCRTEGFVTMLVARLDLQQMDLQFASAGHEIGLLLRESGELVELRATGMVLGVAEDQTWVTEIVPVEAGDRLLLVTDGVTEAMNPNGEMFGRKNLAASFEASRRETLVESVEEIEEAVRKYCEDRPFSDDVTVLALEITADGSVDKLQQTG